MLYPLLPNLSLLCLCLYPLLPNFLPGSWATRNFVSADEFIVCTITHQQILKWWLSKEEMCINFVLNNNNNMYIIMNYSSYQKKKKSKCNYIIFIGWIIYQSNPKKKKTWWNSKAQWTEKSRQTQQAQLTPRLKSSMTQKLNDSKARWLAQLFNSLPNQYHHAPASPPLSLLSSKRVSSSVLLNHSKLFGFKNPVKMRQMIYIDPIANQKRPGRKSTVFV